MTHTHRDDYLFYTLLLALAFLLMGALMRGQTSTPAPASVPSPTPIPELHRLRLLNAYKTALLKQDAVVKAQQDLQASIALYQSLVKDTVQELKLPAETTFNVNAEAGTVESVSPTKPVATAKPEEPAKK